jgi:hypothetical protein
VLEVRKSLVHNKTFGALKAHSTLSLPSIIRQGKNYMQWWATLSDMDRCADHTSSLEEVLVQVACTGCTVMPQHEKFVFV